MGLVRHGAAWTYLCSREIGLLHQRLLLLFGRIGHGAVLVEPTDQQVGDVFGKIGASLLWARLRRVFDDENERIVAATAIGKRG